MMKRLREAIISAEKTLGFQIAAEDAAEVLMYTVRKCKVSGKGADYLPILFETELLDHFFRAAINACSAERMCSHV